MYRLLVLVLLQPVVALENESWWNDLEAVPRPTRDIIYYVLWPVRTTQKIIEDLAYYGFPYVSWNRDLFKKVGGGREPDDIFVTSEDRVFDGVPVRVYLPRARRSNGPAILYIHGGGWLYMSIDTHDKFARAFSIEVNAVVVSVGYRLAPEAPFPAQLDDCFTALRFLMLNAHRWAIDPTRIAVAGMNIRVQIDYDYNGDSAGGHLTVALAIRWRERVIYAQRNPSCTRDPILRLLHPIKLQVPLYPALQFANHSTTSMLLNRNGLLLWKKTIAWVRAIFVFGPQFEHNNTFVDALYTGKHTTRALREQLRPLFEFGDPNSGDDVDRIVTQEERDKAVQLRALPKELHPDGDARLEQFVRGPIFDPEISPLLADSLADLPRAYVVTCGHDPLRDEGLLYVKRLRSARVGVNLKHYPKFTHGHLGIDRQNHIQKDLAAFLQRNGWL